jgi:hypothetical protein
VRGRQVRFALLGRWIDGPKIQGVYLIFRPTPRAMALLAPGPAPPLAARTMYVWGGVQEADKAGTEAAQRPERLSRSS